MTQMPVSFFQVGRRWFSGKRLNQNYENFNPCKKEDTEELEDDDDTDLDEDKVVDGYWLDYKKSYYCYVWWLLLLILFLLSLLLLFNVK